MAGVDSKEKMQSFSKANFYFLEGFYTRIKYNVLFVYTIHFSQRISSP